MKKILKVTCKGAALLELDKLEDFQGGLKDLSKANYKKFRKALEQFGFSFPFFVWRDHGHNWTIDGHQRTKILKTMRQELHVSTTMRSDSTRLTVRQSGCTDQHCWRKAPLRIISAIDRPLADETNQATEPKEPASPTHQAHRGAGTNRAVPTEHGPATRCATIAPCRRIHGRGSAP